MDGTPNQQLLGGNPLQTHVASGPSPKIIDINNQPTSKLCIVPEPKL